MRDSAGPLTLEGREFVVGAIKEIKLKNFLIYDNAKVNPGPHLNVIIGPNATGKSTIVNAICLGLAGKTSILGRAKDINAFIKQGHNKGSTEIRLQGAEGKPDHVIKRVISRNGNPCSTWFVNGRQTQQKQVEELVSSLNIQVSNLCQFLPQDRVADFIKMSSTELLVNTMHAADKDLYDVYCKLKDAQKVTSSMYSEYTKLEEQLEREKALNSSLQQEVNNLSERQNFEKQLRELKWKRPWVEYEQQRLLFIEQKEEKDDLERRYTQTQADNAPAKRALEAKKKKVDEKMREHQEMGSRILECSRKVTKLNDEQQSFTDKVDEVEDALRRKKGEEEMRIKKRNAMKLQIASFEKRLSDLQAVDHRATIQTLAEKERELIATKHSVEEDIRSLASEREGKRHEIIAIESELRKIRDVDSQKLNVVRRVDRHTYDAIMWLRHHKDEFESVIYEPPLMTLNVKDKKNAKYLENSISFNNLKFFICKSKADHEKFYRKVREEQNLLVNVAVALHSKPDHYQPPAPIETFKRFGFHSYLKSMVDAPDDVMTFLCHLSELHKIPVGTNQVNSRLEEIAHTCKGKLRMYLSDSHSVLRAEETELVSRGDEKKRRLTEVTSEIDAIKAQRKQLIKEQSEHKSLAEQIKLKKHSLAKIDQDEIDLEREQDEAKKKLAVIHEDRLKMFIEQTQHTKKVVDFCKKRCKISIQSLILSQQYREEETKFTASTQQLVELEREVNEKRVQLNKTKDVAKRLHAEAKRVIGNPDGLTQEMQNTFQQLPKTLEDIDSMIADVQARMELIIVNNDQHVFDEYNRSKEAIEKLQTKLSNRHAQQQTHHDEVEQIKGSWLTPLNDIIDKINSKFSDYFRQIKCAGEVMLNVPANPDDYCGYGIGINVKFGDNKPMKELTTFQSGGERSVATVLYMLSLQELSSSPFRCVDEINQGMDAENERRVFELVVKTACRPSTPQYFLLTPKLLPDLLYTERMSVHIVHNGPYMLSHECWDTQQFLNKRRQFDD